MHPCASTSQSGRRPAHQGFVRLQKWLPRNGENYCPGLVSFPVPDNKNATVLKVVCFCVCYRGSPVRLSKVASQNPRRARRAAHKILEHQAVRDASCCVQSPTPELRFPLFLILKRGCSTTFSNESGAPFGRTDPGRLRGRGMQNAWETQEKPQICRCTAPRPSLRPEAPIWARNHPEPPGTTAEPP